MATDKRTEPLAGYSMDNESLQTQLHQLRRQLDASEALLLKIEAELWGRGESQDLQDQIHEYFKRD